MVVTVAERGRDMRQSVSTAHGLDGLPCASLSGALLLSGRWIPACDGMFRDPHAMTPRARGCQPWSAAATANHRPRCSTMAPALVPSRRRRTRTSQPDTVMVMIRATAPWLQMNHCPSLPHPQAHTEYCLFTLSGLCTPLRHPPTCSTSASPLTLSSVRATPVSLCRACRV
jgi:hypothetical protein